MGGRGVSGYTQKAIQRPGWGKSDAREINLHSPSFCLIACLLTVGKESETIMLLMPYRDYHDDTFDGLYQLPCAT